MSLCGASCASADAFVAVVDGAAQFFDDFLRNDAKSPKIKYSLDFLNKTKMRKCLLFIAELGALKDAIDAK